MYSTLVQFCKEAKSESREPEDFLIPACSFSPIILLSCFSPIILLLPYYPIILLIFPSDAAPLIKELLGCSNYSYPVQYFLFCQILQYFPFLQNFAKFPLFAKLQYRCLHLLFLLLRKRTCPKLTVDHISEKWSQSSSRVSIWLSKARRRKQGPANKLKSCESDRLCSVSNSSNANPYILLSISFLSLVN